MYLIYIIAVGILLNVLDVKERDSTILNEGVDFIS